ncbi:acetylornithine aminotransferase apoenzyme [Sulfobacillus thermosulfidooxidans DSM 9293]|uniref:Acetylornithine aminotransferase apoenzyme n=2 Tax=Sulfobacillus thermosulfidooxidans TaxID=28034 RepID=A0A1W1W780_SULTA|nr:acetylornithine aminotransferase apoenzyme [Sulfobacillus thermosulfidooxidans DSM 9293]
MAVYARYPVTLSHGQGAEVWDIQGKHYWDFLAGIGVNALGYHHERVVKALNQAVSLTHTSNLFWHQPGIDLSNKMAEITHGYWSLWANSGTEANEAGIKLMRRYGKTVGRSAILSLSGGFHGRTMGSLSATFVPAYQDPFTPLVPEFYEVEAGNLSALEEALDRFKPCGLIVEAIQGEGGVIPLPPGYLSAAAKLAQDAGTLLMVDEVQTGMGRTGDWFGFQHEGIKPDIITVAKGIGAGISIGGMLAKKEVARYFQPGDHGTTFGGNPLAATVALEVLDWLQSEGLEHVRQMAPKMEAKLVALQDAFPEIVSGYRGRGLMWGLVVKVPAKTLVLDALDNGLILNAPKPDVIRMLPPLIIDDRALDAFFEIMTQVFSSYITSQREGA